MPSMEIELRKYTEEIADYLQEEPNKVSALIAISRGSKADEWTCVPGVMEALYQLEEIVDDYLARKHP